MVELRITAPVRETFPRLFVNVIVVRGLDNQVPGAVRDRIDAFARCSEAMLRQRFSSRDELQSDPDVAAYFELFKQFGSNPKRVKPSHFALCDRVLRGGILPDINPAVNLYNAFSVRYVVPFGGEDLEKIDDFFELGYATGDESWTPIGSEEPQTVRRGDVVWRDGSEVSTTSLNHRQCEKTKLIDTTGNAYFLSEGVRGTNDAAIEAMSVEFVDVFGELLGGSYERHVLDTDQPSVHV